jgi:hypothetical protein
MELNIKEAIKKPFNYLNVLDEIRPLSPKEIEAKNRTLGFKVKSLISDISNEVTIFLEGDDLFTIVITYGNSKVFYKRGVYRANLLKTLLTHAVN